MMKNVEFTSLKLIREKREGIYNTNINNFDNAGKFFKELIGSSDREVFALIGIDIKGKINNYAVSHIGTIDEVVVSPREIFKYALLSNSSKIIIAHNHPSGNLTPSSADRKITKKLVESSKLMDIEILDHLIVSDCDYLSLKMEYGDLFE